MAANLAIESIVFCIFAFSRLCLKSLSFWLMGKKTIFLLLSLMYMVNTSAQEYFEYDGIRYWITSKTDNTVSVTSPNNSCVYEGDIIIPPKVSYNDVEYSVTQIDGFDNCTNLTSISIPESVTTIGQAAFYNCNKLASIIIPNGVISIESFAFYGCSNLSSITISENVTQIETSAFDGTAWFDNQQNGLVYIGKVLYCYKGYMPSNTEITIQDGTKVIADGAFSLKQTLASVSIPEGVITIGESAFANCTGLTAVSIPSSVNKIGLSAFAGCNKLVEITVNSNNNVYDSRDNCNAVIETATNVLVHGCKNTVVPNSVEHIGAHAFYGTRLTSITLPQSVTSIGVSAFKDCEILTSIVLSDEITRISNMAFSGCKKLSSINLPENVTTIGSGAFEGCSSLTSISIPNKVSRIEESTFENCTALQTVQMSEGIESIGSSAFEDCWKLNSVIIPEGVKKISTYAFSNCIELSSVTFPESLIDISRGAFDNTAWYNDQPDGLVYAGDIALKYKGTMPDNTTIIIRAGTKGLATEVFDNCTGLISVIIPSGVTHIGNSAFSGCSDLTRIEIPSTVRSIGAWAFSACSKLSSLIIPESVSFIGQDAFINCSNVDTIYWKSPVSPYCISRFCKSSLKHIEIGKGLTDIQNYTFQGCSSLKSVILPEGITSIGHYAFDGCSSLSSIVLPESLTSIGTGAFQECRAITSIIIPESVTTIGGIAFDNCIGITSITVPKKVTNISDDTFYGCINIDTLFWYSNVSPYWCNYSSLKFVELGDSLNKIGENAFMNCYNLSTINIPSSVTYISRSAFAGCDHLDSLIWNSKLSPDLVTEYCRSSLKKVYIGDSVDVIPNGAFGGCSSLECVRIPEDVKKIGRGAFAGCSKMASITLPNSITDIDPYAFARCSSLSSVVLPSKLTSLKSNVFQDCSGLKSINIPENITNIDYDVCLGCNSIETLYLNSNISPFYITRDIASSLKYVVIGENVDTIGYMAFYDCKKLASIIIPDNVVFIDEDAFYGTEWYDSQPDGLVYAGKVAYHYKGIIPDSTTVVFREGTKGIASKAFMSCDNIVSIIIPSSVVCIGRFVVAECDDLSSITIDPDNPKYDSRDNCNAIIESATNTLITGCKNSFIPSSVTSIQQYAFYYCQDLASVYIPSSVTSIGSSAFYYCNYLTSISISEGVDSIAEFVFSGGYKLKEFYCASETPPATNNYSFQFFDDVYSTCILYVPDGCVEKYRLADGWNQFQNIQIYDPTSVDDVFIDDRNTIKSVAYYNLKGERLNHPQNGINIIKSSNGKIKKVFFAE